MPADSVHALLDQWDEAKRRVETKLDSEQLNHRRLLLALPEFLESLRADLEQPFKVFNERVGNGNEFALSIPDGGVLAAAKDSYPKATMHVGVIPELASLSLKGETLEGEFRGTYTLRIEEMQIHLEERFSKKRVHVTTRDIERKVLLPFLASVLNSMK